MRMGRVCTPCTYFKPLSDNVSGKKTTIKGVSWQQTPCKGLNGCYTCILNGKSRLRFSDENPKFGLFGRVDSVGNILETMQWPLVQRWGNA